ncbi:hypothetical protein F4804DRAFT_17888 [Jackrogersella minutella]|nr:hypothetical protein F4804DRAFT_17888 [Jackrogersella minutella]
MAENELTCETCGEPGKLAKFCEGCNDYYCDECWPRRRAHKGNIVGPTGIPHNQLDPKIVKKVNEWMAEPEDEYDEHKQHELDEDSVWFGLSKDKQGDPMLAEYKRFTTLMIETSEGAPSTRYPGLVSFVGQTGAGKSTLIRLLMDAKSHDGLDGESSPVAAPVIGRSNQDLATSADVHLYLDPKTCSDEQPILFADCEGFEGGERDPVAQTVHASGSQGMGARARGPISRIVRATKRALRWASRNTANFERTSKRQFAVAEMYPRIFHAFSDVIVFVLNNPKTLEDIVERLILWANANHSASINLPSKPHVVIALNKCPSSTPGDKWSRHNATEDFLKSMDAQIQKNKTFDKYAKTWTKHNITITSMQELFTCYYSSVHVVRLPDKSRYQLIHKQRDTLYEVIHDCCKTSLNKKRKLKMLPDVDQFQTYVSLAFDHFSETLERPFDYVQASLKLRPPLVTMADNVLEFVVLFVESCRLTGDMEELFLKITQLMASCIMLDSVRKRHFGQPRDWFDAKASPHSDSEEKKSYKDVCTHVIQEYFETKTCCSYNIPAGGTLSLEKGFQCESTLRTHCDMHRQKRKFGAPRDIPGNYQSTFNLKAFAWEERIREKLLELHQGWEDDGASREARALTHRDYLCHFYTPLISEKRNFFCNSVCLVCLFNPPQHALSCGHIICAECAIDFGRFEGGTQIVVDGCPLANEQGVCDIVSAKSKVPTVIQLLPAYSGLRVLTLDGGGVRGIVELTVLKAIEDRIGLPLQRFFDLVVGTSTGGIISLGFGHKQWSVDECMTQFQNLVAKAFTPHKAQKYPWLKHVELIIKKGRYKTKPLEDALKLALGSGSLFGSPETHVTQPLKVAVTATSEAGTKPYILSNYNVRRIPTPPSKGSTSTPALDYTKYRPTRPSNELQIWQAARATSAAPGYFKPFSGIYPELMDGAILHNNPIEIAMEEARHIALAGSLCATPDIVLSLGTGLQKDTYHQEDKPSIASKIFPKSQPKLSFFKMLFTMVKNQMQLNLDADARWTTWYQKIHTNQELVDRCYRINPDLGVAPPLMDDVVKVTFLRQTVTGWTNTDADAKCNIGRIACTLVASSFYFEHTGSVRSRPNSSLELNGMIRCRLSDPAELKALGRFLDSGLKSVSFVVIGTDELDQTVSIPLQDMVEYGHYDAIPVTITLPAEEKETRIVLRLPGFDKKSDDFNISGFPRKLMQCDFAKG